VREVGGSESIAVHRSRYNLVVLLYLCDRKRFRIGPRTPLLQRRANGVQSSGKLLIREKHQYMATRDHRARKKSFPRVLRCRSHQTDLAELSALVLWASAITVAVASSVVKANKL
jgi:hypothetical protein